MQPVSPPKAEVDDSPLHNAMDKNKESLKVKLMLRRPINQLVAQGIMPPLKTPPGYHEQRQKLERAKMGDLLKAKIQQRPDREELVRQHILEDVGHVDPSLAERQRQLKKCRLADALNDQLSHRPGPLELIKKNILHTEEPIERAIKEGAIEFKATSEGTATKPTHPDHYMLDEDSSSLSPPPPLVSQSNIQVVSDEAVVTSTTTSHPPPAPPPLPPAAHQVTPASSTGIVTVLLTPTAAIALPAGATTIYSSTNGRSPQQAQPQAIVSSVGVPSPASSIGRDKSRKKSKAKAQPKTRTIKFHEYKGPPNAQKNNNQNSTPVETSYELLLQQQQLFLQWQLEWQHKYPRLLPASQKPNSNLSSETNRGNGHVPPPPPLPEQSPPPAPPKPLTNLEDMKVSDLKAELKRRNLPVSGAKPQLIERLKPFSESAASNSSSAASSSPAASSSIVSSQHTQDDSIPSVCSVSSSQTIGSSCGGAMMMDTTESPSSPSPTSPTSSTATTSTTMETSVGTSTVAPDDIIRDQQRKIDMLQRQLNMQNQNTFQVIHVAQEPITNAKASLAAFLQQQQLNQLALQQSQHLLTTNNNNNNNNNNNSIKLIDAIKIEEDSQDGRTIMLPNFKGTFLTNGSSDILNHLQPQEYQSYLADNKHLFQIKPDMDKQMIGGECEEVKSQIVDDVLEILIKNGELPAIAAAEPVELSSLQEMDNNDLMEVDTDWLDSLMCSGSSGSGCTSNTNTCDPLLAVGPPSPFDLLIDEDFKLPHCGTTTSSNDWDRMDFAI